MKITMVLLYFILATCTLVKSTGSVNWKTFNRTEYAYFDTKVSWINAQRHCLKYGAHLAHPNSEETNKFVVTLTDQKTLAWIGGSNLPDKTTWEWHHPLAPITFNYWADGQPNNAGTDNCLEFWNSPNGYKWADGNCAILRPFICERPARSVTEGQKSDFDADVERKKHCLNLCLK